MQQRSVKKSGAFGWYFQRVTGVAIVILFIGHFWVQHMPTDALSDKDEYEMIREAYKNKYPDYKKAIEEGKISEAKEGEHLITYEKVTARLSNPVWKVFNILFLIFGLYHGFNGIFNICLRHLLILWNGKLFKTQFSTQRIDQPGLAIRRLIDFFQRRCAKSLLCGLRMLLIETLHLIEVEIG